MTALRIALTIVALLVALAAMGASDAAAFPPPYDPFLPQYELSRVVPEVKARGMQAPYRVENTSGLLPRWSQQVSLALDTASPNPNSYGRILAPWLTVYRDDANPVVTQRAASTAAFEVVCGGWAIGCAQWWLMPAITHYRAAAMVAWGDESVGAVIQHETHHQLANACDQYLHGDPTDDIADPDLECRYTGGSTCTGNQDTVMDCNLAARFIQPYDVDVFLLRYGLQRQSCEGPTDLRWGGTWNPCAQVPGTQRFGMWEHPDGRAFDPATGFWYMNGELIFDYCDRNWNGRHSAYARSWAPVGAPIFLDAHLYWWPGGYPPC